MFALTSISRFVPESTRKFSKVLEGIEGLPFVLQRTAALVALLLLSPVMLFSLIAIRMESRGPAIYTQTRVGYLGRRFKIYKFRSMYLPSDPRYVDISSLKSDREGVCKKLFKDPRITRVGRVIRKLSIDELPQLLNVLQGDMSLIGPRPALPQEVEEYTLRQFKRLDTLPGLTGLWQVSGRADTSFEEQMQLDIRYVEKRSLALDLYILLVTVPAVLSGRGAY